MLPYGRLIIFPDYDVRYIAINDNVDTFKSENELMAFKNIFNDWFARDTSRKIRAVFKAKGNSGKSLATRPPYGYKKSEFDKDVWVVDDEAAEVVRKIFQMCIGGFGPSQIARKLSEQQVSIPTSYLQSRGRNATHNYKKPYRWCEPTVAKILESMEYAGHTVNFKSQIKSYKCKKRINHAKEDWVVFENTHEPIVSQHDFDLVQELYEDNVAGKISDERFDMMSKGYEDEQSELKVKISELLAAIEEKEQKSADTSQFLEIVRKYTEITELTPEIMHELIERIVVHAPDKSSGHRVQQIDIYYRRPHQILCKKE